jgi:hypothetical protein
VTRISKRLKPAKQALFNNCFTIAFLISQSVVAMADCEISLLETADVEIQDHADQSAENIPEKRQSVEDMLALKKEELAGLLQEDVSKMNLHQANAH